MKLSEYLLSEKDKHLKEIEKLKKEIFNIRNGLDLEAGDMDRDEFTIRTLVNSRKASISYREGSISTLNAILKKLGVS